MPKQIAIIERTDKGFMGRVVYKGDLFVTEGKTISIVENKLGNIIMRFSETKPNKVLFDIRYDLSSIFQKLDYLKISSVARLAGINPSLMRQYAIGNKHPSPNQTVKIEGAILEISKELASVRLYAKNSR